MNREEALQRTGWTPDKKEKVQKVLLAEYMSSEESDEEEEQDGHKRQVFRVKPLPWERKELREVKRSLDQVHLQSLSKRALYKRYKRDKKLFSKRDIK